MRDHRKATIASVLAVALTAAAGAAMAQTAGQATNPTGQLPDNSLAGQREGAMTGGTAPQTARPEGSSGGSAKAPTGNVPDDSLAGKREGAIGGSVTQGGSGSTDGASNRKQEGTGQ